MTNPTIIVNLVGSKLFWLSCFFRAALSWPPTFNHIWYVLMPTWATTQPFHHCNYDLVFTYLTSTALVWRCPYQTNILLLLICQSLLQFPCLHKLHSSSYHNSFICLFLHLYLCPSLSRAQPWLSVLFHCITPAFGSSFIFLIGGLILLPLPITWLIYISFHSIT